MVINNIANVMYQCHISLAISFIFSAKSAESRYCVDTLWLLNFFYYFPIFLPSQNIDI